jgi:hypothetical protein
MKCFGELVILASVLLVLPVLTADVHAKGNGYLLKRSTEETCHACHKTDRNAPSDPDSIKTHNSANTGSTKWANGWGVAGGKYGEFACTTCHTPHGTTNVYLIRETINTPDGSNWETSGTPSVTVDFRKKSAADAPDPGSYVGVMGSGAAGSTNVCMVCHSLTSHFKWNGGGSDQLHGNVGGEAGADCTVCHNHKNGFAHGTGSNGTGCWQCHGHDAGYVFTYSGTEYTSQGKGTFVAHSTHTENDSDDLRGPNLQCGDCHNTSRFPYFKDGATTLAATTVCNPCHSPGGDYDGVNDAVIGAKNNWSGVGSSTSAVYAADGTLQPGKEKWCAGCHDNGNADIDEGSKIDGITAPNVIGDEDATVDDGYLYGDIAEGWGFYKTGHGLAQGAYPATQAPAANKGCLDCHDSSKQHIDGEPRTYNAAADNYQAGYRLKDVNGGPPMDIPRSGNDAADFALCFECHDSAPYTVETNYTTNFRNGTTGVNAHWYHLIGAPPAGFWDSDWDGTADSRISCPACHNVHGSPSPAMIRHGELISTPGTTDKVPSLGFQYTPENTYPSLMESTGGKTRFIGPGQGSIAKNGICTMCHNDTYTYLRDPHDNYAPKIDAIYGKVGNSTVTVRFSEGVYSENDGTGGLVPADFSLNDVGGGGKTITGVTHTAGENFATLILSSPLAAEDIDTDTIAAASTASIYDASGNAMGITPVTISGDPPPSVSNLYPADGAVDVSRNSDLSFILSDIGSGIDWSTLSILLEYNSGDFTYYDTDTKIILKPGTLPAYLVTVDPDFFFESGETITATINVKDLAGNSLTSPSWSFTAASTDIWETPEEVYDSLYLGSPGNLIDENTGTGNTFGAGGPDHRVTFKLDNDGDLYSITDVRLYGGSSYTSPNGWTLYTSLDGLTFTKVGNNLNVGGSDQWFEYGNTFPGPVTARYFRIDDWHLGPESKNAAYEFQFKGTPVVNTNNAPSLSWTSEVGYTTDGVDPDSAIGGTDFEFRVTYTDADNQAPTVMQVWIDSNDNGAYESTEKYDLIEADSGDADYTDGKVYTTTKPILYEGDGNISYRFIASDGTDLATGSPTADSQVSIENNVPILAWTGQTHFETGGVYPDSATSGNSFEFRVSYSDVDNTVPTSIQVWVDLNDDGDFDDPGEKQDMTELDSGDTVITDGKLYTKTIALDYAGDGNLNYRFYATDGTDDAVGDPVSGGVVHVIPGSNIAPTLAWTGEAGYTADGVDPDIAIGGSDFVFKVSYADADNDPNPVVQVWVDRNDDGDYEDDGEKTDMTTVDGTIYTVTLTLAHGNDRDLRYCFYASDGTDVATGAPVFDNTVTVTNDAVLPGTVGYWKFEEGSGTAALDETINLNDGTISGAARTAGISGEGLSFDGVNDYVQIPDDDSLDLTSAGSIEVWAWKNSQMYVTKGNTTEYQLMDYSTTGRIAVRWGSDSNSLTSSNAVPTGSWHHIVATYDGSTISLYIDGSLSNSKPFTTDAVANTTPVRIGARGNAYYFDGLIDEVVIYNRALTDTEVMERYNLYAP